MNNPNFDVESPMFAIQELSFLNLAWGNYSAGEIFSINGSGSFRLARVVSDSGYDAAVVEKLDAVGEITDAVFLNQGASGSDIFEVLSINGGGGSQAELAARYYQESAAAYSDFTLKLSGHSMGGALANYTLAKLLTDGGDIPETYTFAAQNARAIIDSSFGNSAALAGYTSNFVTQNDYFFSDIGAFPLRFFLDTNMSGEGFTDQYVLPMWDDAGGNGSHTQVFLDIADPDSVSAYDSLELEIRGGSSGTILQGNSVGNIIYGNQGDDVLIGGGGADILWGGEGADIFTYTKMSDSLVDSADTIQDFVSGMDKIDISAVFSEGNILYVEKFGDIPGQAILGYDMVSNIGSLSVDFTGDGVSDFALQLVGQALTTDIIS
ncbi:TPA: M10 family metallopeptidase C-terminal domain-containing protein [Pseudomonas aeruginosa]